MWLFEARKLCLDNGISTESRAKVMLLLKAKQKDGSFMRIKACWKKKREKMTC